MADPAENERPGRHPNLWLPRRSLAHAADHALGQDRQIISETFCGCKLAGLRKDLHSWQREVECRSSDCIGKQPCEPGTLCPLAPLASAKSTRNRKGKLESHWIRSPSQPNDDGTGKLPNGRFLPVAARQYRGRSSDDSVAQRKRNHVPHSNPVGQQKLIVDRWFVRFLLAHQQRRR